MAGFYKLPRGTSASLTAKAGASTLIPYQSYWLTDLNRVAVATAVNAYVMIPNSGEISSQTTIRTITYVIDGGGSAITTGLKGFLEIPFACTINRWTLLADQAGSVVVDIWKDTYANSPPTVADSITAAAKPALSSSQKAQSTSLTGWSPAIAADSFLGFNVDSAATITRLTLSLRVSVS